MNKYKQLLEAADSLLHCKDVQNTLCYVMPNESDFARCLLELQSAVREIEEDESQRTIEQQALLYKLM